MYQFRFFTLSFSLFFLAATISCNNERSDDQIKGDVEEKLKGTGGNGDSKSGVTYTVKDGVVTLDGGCNGENCADSVAAAVKEVKGVKEVVNNVKQAPLQTDYTLRTSIQTIVSKYQGVQADVADGVVVLRGTIQRDQVQPLMNELGTLQAKRIDNQLAVQQ